MGKSGLIARNTEVINIHDIPGLSMEEFRQTVIEKVHLGERIASLFGLPAKEPDQKKVIAVLADGANGSFSIFSTICGREYPSLSNECPQAELFEREMAEQWGLIPTGHPWLKPVRFPLGRSDYFQVEGEEIHEVAVGPVHAGIIEPGHFRFQCHGEDALTLEISLGYQYRGVESKLAGGPDKRTLHYFETLAGDTTMGHATAYAHLVESLGRCEVPARADAIRAIALELERLANHAGDIGALAGDVGYLPTASYCGRLRGDFLNMTATICGNRFGRGLVRAGGVQFDISNGFKERILESLEKTMTGLTEAAQLLWHTPSVLSRFEGTGGVSTEICEQLGMVGPAARACGFERDARLEYPSGYFRFSHIPVSTWHTGDVFSRAYLRWIEIQRSAAYVRDQLEQLPESPLRAELNPLANDSMVISLTEGWRGEICHVAITDEKGKFVRYKVVDPSFHNWKGLAMALRGAQISDFPLINKSFNLSYAGHDL